MPRDLTLKYIPLSRCEPLQPKGSKGVGRCGHGILWRDGPQRIHIEDTKYCTICYVIAMVDVCIA
jgi:hypothetical protein